MREHKLKCWESVFLAVRSGLKTAEYRRNDRDFAVGDVLVLERYRPGYYGASLGDGGAYLNANGYATTGVHDAVDVERVRVTHITTGVGIPDGFVMMSFAPVKP